MADGKGAKLARRWSAIHSDAANATCQPLLDFLQKSPQFRGSSLDDQFHPTIWQVLNETGDSVTASNSTRRVAKTYPLHMARVENLSSFASTRVQ